MNKIDTSLKYSNKGDCSTYSIDNQGFKSTFTPPSPLRTFALRILEIGKVITELSQFIFTPSTIVLDGSLCRRLVLSLLYPISVLYSRELFGLREPTEAQKQVLLQDLIAQGFMIEEGVTEKEGQAFHYLYISHPDNDTSKIAMEVTGNMGSAWRTIKDFHRPQTYKNLGYNLLIVDGPNIGGTLGDVNAYTMGLSQEAALCLAERKVSKNPLVADTNGTIFFDENGKKIKQERVRGQILAVGHSLGGAILGQALRNHKHNPDFDYHYVFNNTFSSATAMGRATLGSFGASLVNAAGLSLDTEHAIRETQVGENVHFSITNSIDDETIPIEQSLLKSLKDFDVRSYRARQSASQIASLSTDVENDENIAFYATRADHTDMNILKHYGRSNKPDEYEQTLIDPDKPGQFETRMITAQGQITQGKSDSTGLWKMSDNLEGTLKTVLDEFVKIKKETNLERDLEK